MAAIRIIETLQPHNGLQVADYCCWAIFRKWQMRATKHYDRIAPAVRRKFGIGMGTEQGPGSPVSADAVPVEESLIRDEHEVARKRLGDEHSVEGVAEGAGQFAGARGVL